MFLSLFVLSRADVDGTQWPGYPPWSRQIPTRDFRNPPGPITRAKLAKNVAKSVLRFIQVSTAISDVGAVTK